MSKIEDWSYLWERPNDYLIVVDSAIFPNDQGGLIFDTRTRYFLGIEDDDLVKSLIQRMRQAGVQSVESRDFHSEPTEASKLVEECLDSALTSKETNLRLKHLKDLELVGVSPLSSEEIDLRLKEWASIKARWGGSESDSGT